MTRWTGILLVPPTSGEDGMASRLDTHLHPIAGRPIVWHAASALTRVLPTPARTLIAGASETPIELFQDLPGEFSGAGAEETPDGPVLAVRAAALPAPDALRDLLESGPGAWIGDAGGEPLAAVLAAEEAARIAASDDPAGELRDRLEAAARLEVADSGILVRDRASLAAVGARVRDRLVQQLMAAGVTFLLPESVLVDVDVRIGRDTVVYPGAVIEGQTTIGEETVVGPGCRIIHSWIGSGVELKGWNYIAHTSIRNRAILEPYVRRGFD